MFPRYGTKPVPYVGYMYVWPQRVFFSAVLVKKSVTFGHFVINGVWVMQSGLDTAKYMFFKSSHFFIFIEKKINKGPSQIMFMVI